MVRHGMATQILNKCRALNAMSKWLCLCSLIWRINLVSLFMRIVEVKFLHLPCHTAGCGRLIGALTRVPTAIYYMIDSGV